MDDKAALLQAIETVWPSQNPLPAVQIKLAAARFLATLPAPYTGDYNTIHLELCRLFGDLRLAFGKKVKATDILIDDNHFIAERPGHKPGSSLYFSLNVPYLLYNGSNIPLEQLPPLITVQNMLEHVGKTAWRSSDPERELMKKALAAHIIREANSPAASAVQVSAARSRAANGACCSSVRYTIQPVPAVQIMFAAVGKPPCSKHEAKTMCPTLLHNEPYFIMKAANPNKLTKGHMAIELNITAIFSDIRTAAVAAAVLASPSAAAADSTAAAAAAAQVFMPGITMLDIPPPPLLPLQQQQQQQQSDGSAVAPAAAPQSRLLTRLAQQRQQQEQQGQQQHVPQQQQPQQPAVTQPQQQSKQQQQQQQQTGVKRAFAEVAAIGQPPTQSPGMLLPMKESLLLLSHTTAADCAAAPVHHFTEQQLLLELKNSMASQQQQLQRQGLVGSLLQQQQGLVSTWSQMQQHRQQQQQQQSPSLQSMLQHVTAAKVIGLDLEFATTAQQQQPQYGGIFIKSKKRKKEPTLTRLQQQVRRQQYRQQRNGQESHEASGVPELAMIQIFAPAVSSSSSNGQDASSSSSSQSWPAAIYLLEVPQQRTAAEQLMHALQPLLESEDVTLVMHDARQDSNVLQQQYGIRMRGLLDTQLLAGLAALAAAGSSSSNSINLNRIGLGKLYELYKYPHPTKEVISNMFRMNARFWFQRPMLVTALTYAADDVRYLLPLAHNMLQQIPAAAIALGNLQLLLAQQGANALQLTPQMLLPGAAGAGSSSSRLAAAAAGQQQQQQCRQIDSLTKITFELRLDHDALGGWFLPKYFVYLYDDHRAAAAAAAAGSSVKGTAQAALQLTAVTGADAAVIVAQQQVSCDQPANATADHHDQDQQDQLLDQLPDLGDLDDLNDRDDHTGDHGSDDHDNYLDDDHEVDEAVLSLSKLLPDRVQADLAPYLAANRQPALVEISADKNRNILFRLSNRTTVELGYSLDISQALQALAAARQQQPLPLSSNWQQQQQGAGDPDLDADSDLQDDYVPFAANGVKPRTALPTNARSQQQQHYYGSNTNPIPITNDLNTIFGSDNRLGIPGTLHRISAIKDRDGCVYGLTYRIGRHIPGLGLLLSDILSSMKASLPQSNNCYDSPVVTNPDTSGLRNHHSPAAAAAAARPQSLLVLGQPGVGKTTLLRDIARILSLPPSEGGLGLSVMIVDTSNELCGDSDVVHSCIGAARRMMVPQRSDQAAVLVEAVQNHNPDVIIVDEIGTPQEVAAARTISQRGVILVGTAHGNNLSTLLRNPELSPLVGGVQAVTLGDMEARATNRGQKVRLERAGAATFTILLELQHRNRWRLHLDVEQSVDTMLGSAAATAAAGGSSRQQQQQQRQLSHTANTQIRSKDTEGRYVVQFETAGAARQALTAAAATQAAAAAAAGRAEHAVGADGSMAQQQRDTAIGDKTFLSAAVGDSSAAVSGSAGWLLDLLHAAVFKSLE